MIKILFSSLVLALSLPLQAAPSALFSAGIEKILLDKANYGQCMAKLSVDPNSYPGPGGTVCKPFFVSFGCDGVYINRGTANTMLGAAQLAMVTQTQVDIRVTDATVYNATDGVGYCLAQRIDNTLTPVAP